MNKPITIHSSRTMMFAELAKVMDYGQESGHYIESLDQNVFNKKSASGVDKTKGYLLRLYGFDVKVPEFKALKYFWSICDVHEKPLLALIYAIHKDYLLAESIEVVCSSKIGNKVNIELLEDNIKKYHPNRYSANTLRSMAQNIASSWKQAGFIEGKTKNIRILQKITYQIAAFAFFMAYLKNDRGNFILQNIGVKALCMNESALRSLAMDAALRDILQFQYGGGVTSFAFLHLLQKTGIDAIKN
jgi:hypothetical protein